MTFAEASLFVGRPIVVAPGFFTLTVKSVEVVRGEVMFKTDAYGTVHPDAVDWEATDRLHASLYDRANEGHGDDT